MEFQAYTSQKGWVGGNREAPGTLTADPPKTELHTEERVLGAELKLTGTGTTKVTDRKIYTNVGEVGHFRTLRKRHRQNTL